MSLSVYVHFPWCLRRCPYCDFASQSAPREERPPAAYTDALLREVDDRGEALADAALTSVFVGGGTPSLWEPERLGRVLATLRSRAADVADDLEVTVECNPSSLDEDGARRLVEAGATRLSVGVQSLDDDQLAFLGRLHDGEGALAALRAARRHAPRASADLMFGLPDQRPDQFLEQVRRMVDEDLDHLSLYALTIEPATRFGRLHRRGRLAVADEEAYARTFEETHEALAAVGFEHYEVSNYARGGHHSRHNQHYWRGGPYLGLGAGAVGCLAEAPGRSRRYRNAPDPGHYMGACSDREREAEEESLGPQDIVREGLMLGLRTRAGVDLAALEAAAGVDPRLGREDALDRASASGHVVEEDGILRVPQRRWLQLDGIVAGLF